MVGPKKQLLPKAERRTAARRSGANGAALHRIFAAVAWLDTFFLRVLRGVAFDFVAHQLAVGLHPVADHLPLRAIPLLELHETRALVVKAGHLKRRHQADGAEFLQALVLDVQVLDAPA